MSTKLENLPKLSSVVEWFEQSSKSLDYYKIYIEDISQNKPTILPELFKGMNTEEFEDYFDRLQNEIRLLFIFNIISLTEGQIRMDFFKRVESGNTDIVSRKYLTQYKKAGSSKAKEIRFETLLEIWKNHFIGNSNRIQIIGEFKNRMKTRHWIAHGRYWVSNSHGSYTVNNTFTKCDELLKLMPYTV